MEHLTSADDIIALYFLSKSAMCIQRYEDCIEIGVPSKS